MICNSFFAFASFCFVCSLLTFPFLFSRILPRPNLTFSRADVFSETFLSFPTLFFFSFFFSRHFSRFFAFPFRVTPTETCQPLERASRIKKLERRNCQVERSKKLEQQQQQQQQQQPQPQQQRKLSSRKEQLVRN